MTHDAPTFAERRLPPLPSRRYFTPGEVCALCGIKLHVLQSWEQGFAQLREARRGSRREVYWHHEVVLIRRIRELLLDLGLDAATVQTRLRLDALGVLEAALPAAELAAESSGAASTPAPAAWAVVQEIGVLPQGAPAIDPPQDRGVEPIAPPAEPSEDTHPGVERVLLLEVKKELEDLKKLLAEF